MIIIIAANWIITSVWRLSPTIFCVCLKQSSDVSGHWRGQTFHFRKNETLEPSLIIIYDRTMVPKSHIFAMRSPGGKNVAEVKRPKIHKAREQRTSSANTIGITGQYRCNMCVSINYYE